MGSLLSRAGQRSRVDVQLASRRLNTVLKAEADRQDSGVTTRAGGRILSCRFWGFYGHRFLGMRLSVVSFSPFSMFMYKKNE